MLGHLRRFESGLGLDRHSFFGCDDQTLVEPIECFSEPSEVVEVEATADEGHNLPLTLTRADLEIRGQSLVTQGGGTHLGDEGLELLQTDDPVLQVSVGIDDGHRFVREVLRARLGEDGPSFAVVTVLEVELDEVLFFQSLLVGHDEIPLVVCS